VHHIVPLAEGGPDDLGNTAALCPNCHRAVHYSGEAPTFREKLLRLRTGP
jgi:5-methylcytosine-specific restriction protein A